MTSVRIQNASVKFPLYDSASLRLIRLPSFRTAKVGTRNVSRTSTAAMIHALSNINVDLTPDEQAFKVMMAPDIFSRIPNGWGLRGATTVDLPKISVAELEATLRMAWEHGHAKNPIHRQKR